MNNTDTLHRAVDYAKDQVVAALENVKAQAIATAGEIGRATRKTIAGSYPMIRWQEHARRQAAPEYSHAMPNGFCLGGHSGRPERWSHDGSRWVAAEPSRYGFCVWGYDNDTPEVARLGVNLSGREVERLADLFLAVEEVALEQGIYENVDHISVRPDNWRSGNAVPSGHAT
jgi:hypothetical protein